MDFRDTYFNIWKSAWDFHKRFSNISDTDEFWEQLVNESSEIVKEYEGKPQYTFMKDLVLTVISEIERVDKRQRRQEGKKNEKKTQD